MSILPFEPLWSGPHLSLLFIFSLAFIVRPPHASHLLERPRRTGPSGAAPPPGAQADCRRLQQEQAIVAVVRGFGVSHQCRGAGELLCHRPGRDRRLILQAATRGGLDNVRATTVAEVALLELPLPHPR
jgi:hypothetical protein